MNEGDTVVVENTCFDVNQGQVTTNVCWIDSNEQEHCCEVVIPDVAQYNIEYRVFTTGGTGLQDSCDQDLVNTDYLAIERLLRIIIPILEQEREERISADTEIWNEIDNINDKLDKEIEDRESADTELWEALSAETEARIDGDNALNDKIDAEIERAQREEGEIRDALNDEIERAISAETALDVKIDEEIGRVEEDIDNLWEALSAETEARIEGDEALEDLIEEEADRAKNREDEIDGKLDGEIARATAAEEAIDGQLIDASKNPYQLYANVGKDKFNLVLESKDGNEEHFIKIKFDGNFGEI